MRNELVQAYYDGPEYLAKLRKKMKVLKELEEDEYGRAAKILDVYAIDPIAFIEDFCFVKFTEFGGATKPFFLFPYQKRIILKILEAENSNLDIDMLIDKPRGMGLTWLISAYFTWRFLFTPNYSDFILSRTETEVDDGTSSPDSCIFGKIRWQLGKLPKWILPAGFVAKKARGSTTDSTLKLMNPDIGSSIIGSSTNANAGRSRRYSTTFIDECFYIEKFQEVYRSLTSVSRLKIFVSTTVESKVAKDFKDMCEANGNYVSLTWRDHPFKDQQWYDELSAKAAALNDPDIMREAEVNYSISPKSQYYPQVSQSEVAPVSYNRDRPLWVSLDVGGKQDLTVIGYWQYDGSKFKLIEAYENTNRPADWYAPFMTPECEYNPEHYNEFQKKFIAKVRTMKKPAAYFGELDHTIKRMPTNTSTADVFRKFGVNILYNQYAINHPPRHAATSQLLPKIIFNSDSDAVMSVYDAICNSRYAGSARMTNETLKPVHGDDGTADRRAMVENFAVNIPRIFRTQRSDVGSESDKSFARAITKSLRI